MYQSFAVCQALSSVLEYNDQENPSLVFKEIV